MKHRIENRVKLIFPDAQVSSEIITLAHYRLNVELHRDSRLYAASEVYCTKNQYNDKEMVNTARRLVEFLCESIISEEGKEPTP